MRKKLLKSKNTKGGKSYSIVIPPAFLDSIGCNLGYLDKTTIDLRYDSTMNKITIGDPEIIEE